MPGAAQAGWRRDAGPPGIVVCSAWPCGFAGPAASQENEREDPMSHAADRERCAVPLWLSSLMIGLFCMQMFLMVAAPLQLGALLFSLPESWARNWGLVSAIIWLPIAIRLGLETARLKAAEQGVSPA